LILSALRAQRGHGKTWKSAMAAAACLALVALIGCARKVPSQEERLEWIRKAYSNLAEASGYRYRAEISYSFPEMDETTRARLAAAIPSSLHLEGEVQQSQGDYRQHAVGTGAVGKLELYVIGGISYKKEGDGGWTATDTAAYRLNISNLYFMAPEDFESMLSFAGDIDLVEDSEQRLVLSFKVGSEYLLSSLEKSRELYASEGQLQVYETLYGIMRNAETEVVSRIYRSNGYLERQDITIRLPDTPLLGTVVMDVSNEFFSYGEALNIELPPEAAEAAP